MDDEQTLGEQKKKGASSVVLSKKLSNPTPNKFGTELWNQVYPTLGAAAQAGAFAAIGKQIAASSSLGLNLQKLHTELFSPIVKSATLPNLSLQKVLPPNLVVSGIASTALHGHQINKLAKPHLKIMKAAYPKLDLDLWAQAAPTAALTQTALAHTAYPSLTGNTASPLILRAQIQAASNLQGKERIEALARISAKAATLSSTVSSDDVEEKIERAAFRVLEELHLFEANEPDHGGAIKDTEERPTPEMVEDLIVKHAETLELGFVPQQVIKGMVAGAVIGFIFLLIVKSPDLAPQLEPWIDLLLWIVGPATVWNAITQR